jgi:hypothetical protein
MRGITLQLRAGRGRIAVVVRLECSDRLILSPVTAAALLGAAILCATDAPPTVGGVSVVGYGLLAGALLLVARLLSPT